MPTAANNHHSRSEEIAHALSHVQARVTAAAERAGRDANTIQLIAVSKTKPLSDITAAISAGHKHFGENYAQELYDKATQKNAEWHFIGPLQSNKTKLVASTANWVHSIDRLKIAQRLNDQRLEGQSPLNVCLQINISNEPQKAGIAASEALKLARNISALPNLKLRGLMCIPRSNDHAAFANMQTLAAQMRDNGLDMDTLSMGMSDDFEEAIAHGATHVRVGTAIFGSRQT